MIPLYRGVKLGFRGVLEVPWGSESICYWCTLPKTCDWYKANRGVTWFGQVYPCPTGEFTADYGQLPRYLKDNKIVPR